jgi:hypothetical protein
MVPMAITRPKEHRPFPLKATRTTASNLRWPWRTTFNVFLFSGVACGALLLRFALSAVLATGAAISIVCMALQLVREETDREAKLRIESLMNHIERDCLQVTLRVATRCFPDGDQAKNVTDSGRPRSQDVSQACWPGCPVSTSTVQYTGHLSIWERSDGPKCAMTLRTRCR